MPSISTSSEKLKTTRISTMVREDDDALDGLVDHDRANDVGDDEHFEAEQDHAAEVLAQVTEGVLTARGHDVADVTSKRAESPDDQNRRPDSFDDVDDVGEELAIRHGGSVRRDGGIGLLCAGRVSRGGGRG